MSFCQDGYGVEQMYDTPGSGFDPKISWSADRGGAVEPCVFPLELRDRHGVTSAHGGQLLLLRRAQA